MYLLYTAVRYDHKFIVYPVMVLLRNSYSKLTPDLEGRQISSARHIILVKGRQLFPPDREIY